MWLRNAGHTLHVHGFMRYCVVLAVALLVFGACRGDHHRPGVKQTQRYVSLAPAITETLFALGVGASVVGVSDYCHFPPEVERLPHLGTGYTPRYEAILGVAPSLVLLDAINEGTGRDLAQVTDVHLLPWLTLEQVVASTRLLGQLTGATLAAERLAAAYQDAIRSHITETSPRILLVLSHTVGKLQEAWYIRENSIHGRILEAAGARNAVAAETNGPPRISLEQVMQLDPDGIIVLQTVAPSDQRLLADWRRLSALRAVRNGRLQAIAAPEVMIPGPRIVELVSRLRPWVDAWRQLQ